MTPTALLLLAACAALPQETDPAIEYEVSMPDPATHLFHVRLVVDGAGGKTIDLAMPVWTPGSYKVRDYSQYLQDFDAGGLPFEQVDKRTWRVHHAGRKFEVAYKVFAHEMSVRTNWLDTEMGTIVGAATFLQIAGYEAVPHAVRVKPWGSWRVATGLPSDGGGLHRAADYDVLVDSPILLGDLAEAAFEVEGAHHRIAVAGPLTVPLDRVARDFKKIVEASVAVFGEIPYRDYVFLVRLHPAGGGGGLEHLNSTLMDVSMLSLAKDDGYRGLLGLAAHEFFHTWNVKRLRPAELGPFDYGRENYTRLLWMMEGFTSYYTPVLLSRAGLAAEDKALESLAGTLTELAATPGRLKESPEMASFNAWIHLYLRGPQSRNTTASYYSTGARLGLALDLEIRRRSSGAKSLDDVLRGLYRTVMKRGRGVTPDEVEAACSEAAGVPLAEFFRRHVRGTEDPDLKDGLQAVGLAVVDEGKPTATLGVSLDGNKVTHVAEGGPAWGRLCVDDEILAVNGVKADLSKWEDHIRHLADGDEARYTLFRRGLLKEVAVPVHRPAAPKFKLSPLPAANPDQVRAREAWLGAGR